MGGDSYWCDLGCREVHGEWGIWVHTCTLCIDYHVLKNKMCCFTLLPLDYPYMSDTTCVLSTLSEGVNLETDAVTQC